MILIDANLLLYAYDSASPHHQPAKEWLEATLSSPQPVRLAWVSILAFLRVGTHPQMRREPLLMPQAVSFVLEWLARPNVEAVGPGDRHMEILGDLLAESQSRGPLVMDAHLAALALEHGATLCTNDRDFSRFAGLRVLYPLSGK